jgi:glycosyltransferase involved in cell wall biosynthesis
MVERLVCALSHRVTINSRSNRDFVVRYRLCPEGKATVIGAGSSHGVDARRRFNPDTVSAASAPHAAAPFPRFLFVGRIAADKGIAELAQAWQDVRERLPDATLTLVGPSVERWNPVAQGVVERLARDPRVHLAGAQENTEQWYAAADIVVLPSYREGFPNVPLEAAAMKRAVITTTALGCVDSVRHDSTGLVVPVRDSQALAQAMLRLGSDPALCARMGAAGRSWVLEQFNPDTVARGLADTIDAQPA